MLPYLYRLEVNFILMSFTVIMLYTIKTNATIIALALKFCQIKSSMKYNFLGLI